MRTSFRPRGPSWAGGLRVSGTESRWLPLSARRELEGGPNAEGDLKCLRS